MVVSKQKGKPPGFGAHGVWIETDSILDETTEVVETLRVGSTAVQPVSCLQNVWRQKVYALIFRINYY
jgi:hypothetical protein